MQAENTNEVISPSASPAPVASDDAQALRREYEARLVTANLRVEAVKSGMIDLDGLKLVDLSGVTLDKDDKVVNGESIMAQLRRDKPWLFAPSFSSSTAAAPVSQPMRQKMASEMTDDEYIAARNALTRQAF